MNKETLPEALRRAARERTDPAGNRYRTLTVGAADSISCRFGLSRREVEIAALKEDIVPERYQRNMGTVGLPGQRRLLESRAAVVGAGGLGGLVVELLARMGVGSLVIVDGDSFADSNLNRQVLSDETNLGKPKAAAAAMRVKQVNGAVEVAAHTCMADRDNLPRLLSGCRVAIDCLDNLPSRFDLEAACQELAIPLVHGAIAGFLGQVTVIWPGEPRLSLIYGQSPGGGDRGVETILGNPAATPAMLAAWQVSEAVKIMAGLEGILRGDLLIIDMLLGEITRIKLADTI